MTVVTETAFTEIAAGLQFPEGPVAMPDGSVVVVEMFGERVTRVAPGRFDRRRSARSTGGPNGLAVGPDGALLPVQQRRVASRRSSVGGSARPGPVRPRPLHRRADPAHRPRRHGDRPVHQLRRPSAARAERPRDGRPRRLLLHRPRHPRRRAPAPPISAPSTTPAATAPRSTRWPIPCTRRTASG